MIWFLASCALIGWAVAFWALAEARRASYDLRIANIRLKSAQHIAGIWRECAFDQNERVHRMAEIVDASSAKAKTARPN